MSCEPQKSPQQWQLKCFKRGGPCPPTRRVSDKIPRGIGPGRVRSSACGKGKQQKLLQWHTFSCRISTKTQKSIQEMDSEMTDSGKRIQKWYQKWAFVVASCSDCRFLFRKRALEGGCQGETRPCRKPMIRCSLRKGGYPFFEMILGTLLPGLATHFLFPVPQKVLPTNY